MLHKPATAPDTLISGLSHVEIMPGGLARFVVYVDRIDPDTKEAYREYPPAQVMSIEMVPDAIQKASAATAAHFAVNVTRLIHRWLH